MTHLSTCGLVVAVKALPRDGECRGVQPSGSPDSSSAPAVTLMALPQGESPFLIGRLEREDESRCDSARCPSASSRESSASSSCTFHACAFPVEPRCLPPEPPRLASSRSFITSSLRTVSGVVAIPSCARDTRSSA